MRTKEIDKTKNQRDRQTKEGPKDDSVPRAIKYD